MTTHETQPGTVTPTERRDRPANRTEPDTREAPAETVSTSGGPPRIPRTHLPRRGPTEHARAETAESTDAMLFADSELSGLRSRWIEVQSAFVDDPATACRRPTAWSPMSSTSSRRGSPAPARTSRSSGARGEEVSTEDLRIALKRYREFFERLLAV